MRKIDRLGWAAGMSFRSYGVDIGIRSTDPEILERVLPLVSPDWKPRAVPVVDQLYSMVVGGSRPGARVKRYHLLYSGALQLVRSLNLEPVLQALEADIEVFVANRARSRLFVHAGVVGWKNRAILLPGDSGSGKSHLVAALLRAGASYYSDEYAVFDNRGRLHPFPRPLALKKGGRERARPKSWKRFGPGCGPRPIPVGMIVLTQYQPQKRWRPRRLTRGEAVLELLRHTVPSRRRPRSALKIFRLAVARASAWKGVRGEAEETVPRLLARYEKGTVPRLPDKDHALSEQTEISKAV